MKKKSILLFLMRIFIFICLIGIVYSSYKVVRWFLEVSENHNINNQTKKSITKIDSEDNEKYQIDFKTLKKQNADTVGYIQVNETKIDYVVVKGKDNSYYLNHNFEKKKNIAGWIFADYHNQFDGEDKNIILYGHNTRDGSMFDTLKNVLDKEWYENEENYKVLFITEMGTYYYQVFSTYSIKPENYYINTEFNSESEYLSFLKKLKNRSVYDYSVDVDANDKILTLSSCLQEGQKRVVLHAKLIEE